MASSINASTSGAGGVITTADNTGILNLQTGGTTAVTVDASQNVGIGTTSPGYVLDVQNASTAGSGSIIGNYNTASSGSSISTLRLRSSGTGASYWDINTGNTASGLNGSIRFFDNIAGTERMRIDSNGWTYINCTSNVSAANAYQNILFDGDLYYGQAIKTSKVTTGSAFSVFVNSAGTTAGSITHNGTTTTAFNTSSDYRLKDNITPMADALQTVAKLKPVTYKWKVDGSDGQGFIAHELAEVVPDCVYGEKDAVDAEGNPIYQGVDTSFLVATLTAAIQELTERVKALEAK